MCRSCFDWVMFIHDWCYSFHQGENHCLPYILALLLIPLTGFVLWKRRKLSHQYMSGKWYLLQIVGAILKSSWCFIITMVAAGISLAFFVPKIIERINSHNYASPSDMIYKVGIVAVSCMLFGVSAYVITNLNKLYSLRKQESRITVSQIILLAIFGICLTSIVFALGIKKDDNSFIIISTFGAVLGWIFQDTIKSVAAFFYLRANGLLQIGDLISVPSKNIEGFVRTISLTTVTIENWDTTTSAFPTYILHSEHFKNSQRMMDGKTLGRLMQKTFVLDSGWIRPLNSEDIIRLKAQLDLDDYVITQIAKVGQLNIEAFRQYVYHWLMEHPHVSQQPRLIVRWLQQTDEGMPLQLFAYLTDTMLDAFEWRQSEIMEHVIKAMGWFDLRLYQSPSGYDASNSNIFLTNHEADYHIKDEENGRIK